VHELHITDDPINSQGPINPRGAAVLGSAFMLREIEAACARASHMRLDELEQCVYLNLPITKTDPTGIGCVRRWGCICSRECEQIEAKRTERPCPYHAALHHGAVLRERFSDEAGAIPNDLPLFPTAGGDTVSKAAFVATLEQLAVNTGEAALDQWGRKRYGGHSMRVSGAQWLAGLGLEVFKIQVLARWSSDVVLRYIGDRHLATIATDCTRLLDRVEPEVEAAPPPTQSTPCNMPEDIAEEIAFLKRQLLAFDARIDEARAATSTRKDLSYVINELSGKVHLMTGDLLAPSVAWRTKCGWAFARAPFRFPGSAFQISDVRPKNRCTTCLGQPQPGSTIRE